MSSQTVSPGPARGQERRLLVLGFLIVVGAYTLLGWSQSSQVPVGTVTYGAAFAALGAIAHFAVRRWAPYADPLFLPIAYLLNGLGLVLIRRVDFAEDSDLAITQTTWMVVAVGLFVLILLVVRDYRILSRYAYTFGLATIVLLILPLFPVIGREVNGARLWVVIGPINFQPGEIAKLTVVVFLAAYLERKRTLLSIATHRVGPLLLPQPRHLAPVLAAAGAALLILVLQRDLGSSLLFFGVFVVMLYLATGRVAYPAIGILAFAAGATIAYQLFDHVQRRFQIWLDPWSVIDDAGWQLAQTTFALGTGGLTGTGLGLGRPDDIPFAATDAIFAVLGEELGLLGGTAVLIGFLLLVVRGFKAAMTARDELGTLLAGGLTVTLALQVFVIVGGVTRLVPFTGITLPFISYGGSSLVSNYALLALLIMVSHRSRAATLGADRARGPKGSSRRSGS